MQTIIIAPHEADETKLAGIIDEMKALGAPSIRALWDGEKWLAVEGAHRIAAAYRLGLTPVIAEVEEDDVVEGHDMGDAEGDTVRDLIEYLSAGHYYGQDRFVFPNEAS